MKVKSIASSVLALSLIAFAVPAVSDPPDESGPNVTRSDETYFEVYTDTEAGLTTALGFNPYQACLEFPPIFDTVSMTFVDVPSADERIIWKFSGYVRASVWPITIPDGASLGETCSLFVNSSPLATGMVDINGTDNDLQAFVYESTNRNVWRRNAHGKLYDLSGKGHNFHFTFKGNWDGNNLDSTTEKTTIKFK